MTKLEKQAMYNMLVEIKRLAANASLTGALSKGAPTLAITYNKCLAALKETGDESAAQLFPELAADAGVDDVGVAAALLASYLQPSRRGLHPHDIGAFNADHYGRHLDLEDEDDEDE